MMGTLCTLELLAIVDSIVQNGTVSSRVRVSKSLCAGQTVAANVLGDHVLDQLHTAGVVCFRPIRLQLLQVVRRWLALVVCQQCNFKSFIKNYPEQKWEVR